MTQTASRAAGTSEAKPQRWQPSPGARRFGFFIAAVLNGVGLWIANRLLDWEWPPFLTRDFEDVLPLINASFIAGIVVNALYVIYHEGRFRSATQIVVNGISLAVAILMFQVFPFDFSPYHFNWGVLARIALIVGMIGIGIGTIVETVRLATGKGR